VPTYPHSLAQAPPRISSFCVCARVSFVYTPSMIACTCVGLHKIFVHVFSSRRYRRYLREYRRYPRGPSPVSTSRCRARQCRRTGELPSHPIALVCVPLGAAVTCVTVFVCAGINRPVVTPANLHYPHYCNAIARLLRNL